MEYQTLERESKIKKETSLDRLILEAYEDGKKCGEADITDFSDDQFLDLLDIQDMLGRTCELKREG